MSDGEVVAGIIEADHLQTYLDVFAPLVHEAKLHFGDHGVRVSCVDPANVAMYHDVTLPPRAFDHFESPGTAVIGINLGSIDDRLSHANAGDLVDFRLNMSTRKLHLEYRNVSQTVACIDPDAIRQEPDRPELDLPNTLTISGADFETAVAVTGEVSDHIDTHAEPDGRQVRMVGEGDTDEASVVFDDETSIDADVTEATTSMYSEEYLADLSKPIPADAEVTLTFGQEFPMRIEYEILDGQVSVEAMLAPRVNTS